LIIRIILDISAQLDYNMEHTIGKHPGKTFRNGLKYRNTRCHEKLMPLKERV
jgi:hypothetical protein